MWVFFSVNILPTNSSLLLCTHGFYGKFRRLSVPCRKKEMQFPRGSIYLIRYSPSMCLSFLTIKILSFLYNLQWGAHKSNNLASKVLWFYLFRKQTTVRYTRFFSTHFCVLSYARCPSFWLMCLLAQRGWLCAVSPQHVKTVGLEEED